MSIIDDVFQPLYGTPCWQVEQGYGSFLTFEFGQPSLHITEPRQYTKRVTKKLERVAARRQVYVHGAWHLWIYLADWRIFQKDKELAYYESTRRVIKRATDELNGQQLTNVSIDTSLVSVFEFDLGGRLEVYPNYIHYEKTSDLWLLFEPSHNVFTLRADGQYDRMPGDISPDEYEWKPLFPKPSTFNL